MLREEEETGGGGKERNTRSRGKGGGTELHYPQVWWASRRESTACENNRFQTFVYE